MSDIFYGFMIAFLIAFFIAVGGNTVIESNENEFAKYRGYIITDMIEGNHLFSNCMTVQNDSIRKTLVVDDIIYLRYVIGDTIK